MRLITPHLWFDKEAKEAAVFYTSAFSSSGGKDCRIKTTSSIHDTPSGSVDVVSIELLGQEIHMISAGPLFKFNPSISLFVACKTKDEVDALWDRLSEGGMPLMSLGQYPFSERYGWTQDRYGLSWQVGFIGDWGAWRNRPITQRIIPTLMFVGGVAGKAEDAMRFYASVFHDAKVGDIARYERGEEPEKAGTVKYGSFSLEGQQFAAMDSARAHGFGFNEAVSLMVHCDTQEQIDYYWDKLSAVPEAEACGWLKDKYGVSWQIVPSSMGEMLRSGDQARIHRVTQAFMKMKKFDLAELRKAAG